MKPDCTEEYGKSGVAFERFTGNTEAIGSWAKEMDNMGPRFSRIERIEQVWLMAD